MLEGLLEGVDAAAHDFVPLAVDEVGASQEALVKDHAHEEHLVRDVVALQLLLLDPPIRHRGGARVNREDLHEQRRGHSFAHVRCENPVHRRRPCALELLQHLLAR
eukprot:14281421-Heterocapsa_arctica.AAC.1